MKTYKILTNLIIHEVVGDISISQTGDLIFTNVLGHVIGGFATGTWCQFIEVERAN
jgi:hypothetical protein